MEEEVFLSEAIHVNKITPEFDIYAEGNEHVLENLLITFDGTIMGVKSAAVLPHLINEEVHNIRIGAAPFPRKFKIENEDDFYKLLALYVPLESTNTNINPSLILFKLGFIILISYLCLR